jgi:YVTN family beta-propeller protein
MKNYYKYLILFLIIFPIFLFAGNPTIKSKIRTFFGVYVFEVKSMPNIKALSFSPDGKELWGTSLMNNKDGVFVLNAENGEKINTIKLPGGGGVEIVFSKDGMKAYVSQMENAKVFEIDTKTKKILRTFNNGGNWSKIVYLSFDNKTLYVANWLSNDISIINIANGKLIKKIKTIKTPRGIYVTEDERFMYVAGFDKGELQKINLTNGDKKIIFKSGGALRHIVFNKEENALFISDMAKASIYKLDLSNDKVIKFATTDSHPNTIEFMHGGKVLVVSSRGVNNAKSYYIPGPTWGSIQFFDTKSGKLIDAIIAGNQPTALSVYGSNVAFSNFLDKKIEVFKFPEYEKLLVNEASLNWSKNYKKYLIK